MGSNLKVPVPRVVCGVPVVWVASCEDYLAVRDV